MPRFTAKVVLELPDGTEQTADVKTRSCDIDDYEAEFDASWFASGLLTHTELKKVFYCAMRRTGEFTGSWEEFRRQVVDVTDLDMGAADARPTVPAPGDDSSAP